ncbi:hypothetical protein LUZ60_001380 [Juncus effusus]|nr:hypothetical protein LUZ60_001380 [Juncus effusus]
MSDYDYVAVPTGKSCIQVPTDSYCVGICTPRPIDNLGGDIVWLNLADATAIVIAILLALGFILAVTQYRLWYDHPILRNLLGLARYPLYQLLGNAALIALSAPYSNEHYLVWGVLLFAGFGSFYSIMGYTLYTVNKKKLMVMNEKIQLSNNLTVFLLLIVYYVWYDRGSTSMMKHSAAFIRPLWAIWAVTMLKVLQRIVSFSAAESFFGKENTRLVAQFMKNEHTLAERDPDPKSMDGYKYLVMGEKHLSVDSSSCEGKLIPNSHVLTIDNVWQCDKCLINDRLKDVCLSFALFKLIKRKFETLDIAEARQRKTRDFVLKGLLVDFDRAFKVVDMELRFLRDYFYSSTPVTFGIGFLLQKLVLFCMIGVTFGVAVSRVINYKTPPSDKNNFLHRKNFDLIVTVIILFLVMFMMFSEFFLTLFSDWAKITLVYGYIKNCRWIDSTPLSCVLFVVLRVSIWGHSNVIVGQYSLLEDFRFTRSKLVRIIRRELLGKKSIQGVKSVRYMNLEQSAKETTLDSLKRLLEQGEPQPTNGLSTLDRYELRTQMEWACGSQNNDHTHIHTIMIWHIATRFCELGSSDTGREKSVAVSLSNYCAYLVVFAPEFLPISANTTKSIFDRTVEETNAFFDTTTKDNFFKKMVDFGVKEQDQMTVMKMTVMEKGARLGNQIWLINDDGIRWKFLAEFWAELILFLAPSKNSNAHAKKLAGRVEFITYLWTLLNHAGILDRSHTNSHAESFV